MLSLNDIDNLKKNELNRILKYPESFFEVYVDFLKNSDFNYYQALLDLCEHFECDEDDIKIIKKYLNEDIINKLEEYASLNGKLKDPSDIIEVSILRNLYFKKVKGVNINE